MSHILYLNGLTVNNTVLSGLADTAVGSDLTAAVNKKYVDAAIATLANGGSGLLDSINELALALGNDENYASTITTALATKATTTALSTAISDASADATSKSNAAQAAAISAAAADATTKANAAQSAAISAAAADATTKANAAQAAAISAAAADAASKVLVETTRAIAIETGLRDDLTALDGRTPSNDSFTELKTYLIALDNYFFHNEHKNFPRPTRDFQ